jgi:PAS domain S-box-containing protein
MLQRQSIPRKFFLAGAVVLAGILFLQSSFYKTLLFTGSFVPHGICFLWNTQLIALHAITDLLIGLSYLVISCTLVYFVWRTRGALPFHWIFLAFGGFIVACGATHLIELVTIWQPYYWQLGGMKAITALASLLTAAALPTMISPTINMVLAAQASNQRKQQLESANQVLQHALTSQSQDIVDLASQLAARQRELEEALKAKNEALAVLDALFAHTPVGLGLWDRNLRCVRINTALAEISGCDPQVFHNKLVVEQAPFGGEADLIPFQAVVSSGAIQAEREVSVGRRTWLTSYYPITTQAGQALGVGVSALDITERKRLEAEFLQAQKMEGIGRLAGGVAHDFNNMLTAINGYAELALEMLPSNGLARDELSEIQKAGQRAADLTRQLLAFARKQVLAPQIISLNDLIANMDRLLRRLISAQIELSTILQPQLWSVKADPGQIEQVVINLALNARDAMPEGGSLILQTSNIFIDAALAQETGDMAPGMYVLLAVSDTGTGMDAETKRNAFEPFFTTKEKARGTGLGLATSYGTIRQHGGTIWIYSELDEGTTVKIYLPAIDMAGEERVEPAVQRALPRGGERVLLVEDELAVRSFIVRVLRDLGYQVIEAENGLDALELMERYSGPPIDLLITDIVMPKLGGRALAQQLRQRLASLRVLYISGYTDEVTIRNGELMPGSAFLSKPFSAKSLALTVRMLCDEPH